MLFALQMDLFPGLSYNSVTVILKRRERNQSDFCATLEYFLDFDFKIPDQYKLIYILTNLCYQ